MKKKFEEHAKTEELNINSMMLSIKSDQTTFTADTFGRQIDLAFEKEGALFGAEVKVKYCKSNTYEDFILEDGLANKMFNYKTKKGFKEVFYINIFEDCSVIWSLDFLLKNKDKIKKSKQMHTSTSCINRNTDKKEKTFYHLKKEWGKVIDFKRI